jgi:hypothetical protein
MQVSERPDVFRFVQISPKPRKTRKRENDPQEGGTTEAQEHRVWSDPVEVGRTRQDFLIYVEQMEHRAFFAFLAVACRVATGTETFQTPDGLGVNRGIRDPIQFSKNDGSTQFVRAVSAAHFLNRLGWS